jgi:hypothetical protein
MRERLLHQRNVNDRSQLLIFMTSIGMMQMIINEFYALQKRDYISTKDCVKHFRIR